MNTFTKYCLAALLAVIAFLVYWPSLSSDFVYDARKEILEEGFITSFANLPTVLSLKVLSMPLLLGTRPGQLLYLMLIALISGKEPLGYHLASNLLHAANVALLFVLLVRFIPAEIKGLNWGNPLKIELASALVALFFAFHPIAVESVAEVSYSSALLVAFFTLTALFAATFFCPERPRVAWIAGSIGTICSFASVACKESGLTTVLMLIVYWFLFRRRDPKLPWLLFLGAASALTITFLTARFSLAPPEPMPLSFLGGSFYQVMWIQPRLWVFMMAKLVYPINFSIEYTVRDIEWPTTQIAVLILGGILLGNFLLAFKSRVGALGVALFWLSLGTVSNFMPLHCPAADRYYYLPLAGLAIQLLALFIMIVQWNKIFIVSALSFGAVLFPLLDATHKRQLIFTNELTLWNDALRVDPRSPVAHTFLGAVFASNGQVDEAISQYRIALVIEPKYAAAHTNLGLILVQKGNLNEAASHYRAALEIEPKQYEAHNNLGQLLLRAGRTDEAIAQFKLALEINPLIAIIHNNLGVALFQKRLSSQAIAQFEEALRLDSSCLDAKDNLNKVRVMMR